jgi:hypothetical protein
VLEERVVALVVDVVNVDVELALLPPVDDTVAKELDDDEVLAVKDSEDDDVVLTEVAEELEVTIVKVDVVGALSELLMVELKSFVVVDGLGLWGVEEVDVEKKRVEDVVEILWDIVVKDSDDGELVLDEAWDAVVMKVVCRNVEELETEDTPEVVEELVVSAEFGEVDELRNSKELEEAEAVRVGVVVKLDEEAVSVDDTVVDDAYVDHMDAVVAEDSVVDSEDPDEEYPESEMTVLEEVAVSIEVADVLVVSCNVEA